MYCYYYDLGDCFVYFFDIKVMVDWGSLLIVKFDDVLRLCWWFICGWIF